MSEAGAERKEISKRRVRELAMVWTAGPILLANPWGFFRVHMRTNLPWEGETGAHARRLLFVLFVIDLTSVVSLIPLYLLVALPLGFHRT